MAEKAKKENGFVRFTKKAGKFFRDCKGEIKKIVWPTPKNVFKNVGVVLATIILLGLFIFLLDTVFMNLLGLVMQVAKYAARMIARLFEKRRNRNVGRSKMVCCSYLFRE